MARLSLSFYVHKPTCAIWPYYFRNSCLSFWRGSGKILTRQDWGRWDLLKQIVLSVLRYGTCLYILPVASVGSSRSGSIPIAPREFRGEVEVTCSISITIVADAVQSVKKNIQSRRNPLLLHIRFTYARFVMADGQSVLCFRTRLFSKSKWRFVS